VPDNRLLIVDDQRLVGELIGKIGEIAGFAVKVTTHVDEFLAELDVFNPSVVTIDLVMPEIDGIELLRELALRGCRAKILVASGLDARMLNSARVLGEELGLNITGVITKPIRAAELRGLFEGLKA
jgi:DNA-binding response OmpR family regulator